MAILGEASDRLMKPAKDLADWIFPFSEVLEEYRTLLEAQRDVNLNKAALVLQNTANAYARRVEYLFQDVASLIQKFIDQEAANESKKNTKKDGKEKKTVIDAIDFKLIDFDRYLGKNNNTKNRNGVNNPVKLVGQRFPQLENASRSSKTHPEDSNQVEREQDNEQDAGRKYAFRCNQCITASGMLVEHLKTDDFPKSWSSEKSSDVSTESTESGIDSNESEENREFSGDLERDNQRCVVSTPLPDKEHDFMNTSFCSAVDSGRGSSLRTTTRPESSLSSDRDGNWDSLPPRPSSSLSVGDLNSLLVESTNDTGLGTTDTSNESTTTCKRGSDQHLGDCSETSNTKSKTLAVEQCRRSKRLKSLFDIVQTPDSGPLEPIPFQSVPDQVRKSRTEFKLPCSISLLKSNERPRKRKITSETRKRRCLEKFSLNESEMGKKKMTMYSPTRQLYFPFMKEELDDVPKCFSKHLRNLRDLDTLKRYEAVTNESMDFLGYKSHDRKPDSLEYEITNTSNVTTTPDITDSADDFPMPDTPESFNSPEPMSPPPPLACSSRIERLVNDIYESTDVRTEEEEAVIKWHENIRSKLRQDENRQKFEISDYTARVVTSLKNNDGRISFHRMVRQDKPTDAPRYLLASLMLANKYNLRIDTTDDGGDLTLSLLKE